MKGRNRIVTLGKYGEMVLFEGLFFGVGAGFSFFGVTTFLFLIATHV